MENSIKIDKREISKFISYMSMYGANQVDNVNDNQKESIQASIEMGLFLGLILGKHRPELADAACSYWDFTRELSSEMYLSEMVNLYVTIRDKMAEIDK